MKRALAVAAGILALATSGRAQEIELLKLPEGFVIQSGDQPAVAEETADDDGKEKKKASEREKRLKKLKYDRRPSVILEAGVALPWKLSCQARTCCVDLLPRRGEFQTRPYPRCGVPTGIGAKRCSGRAGAYWAVMPPSMTSSLPVMNDDSSEARNSTP